MCIRDRSGEVPVCWLVVAVGYLWLFFRLDFFLCYCHRIWCIRLFCKYFQCSVIKNCVALYVDFIYSGISLFCVIYLYMCRFRKRSLSCLLISYHDLCHVVELWEFMLCICCVCKCGFIDLWFLYAFKCSKYLFIVVF